MIDERLVVEVDVSIDGIGTSNSLPLLPNTYATHIRILQNRINEIEKEISMLISANGDLKDFIELEEKQSVKAGVTTSELTEIGDTQTNYSVQSSQGLFPEPSKTSLADSLNAGRGTAQSSKLMPDFLQEIQFRFFDNVTFPFTIIPYKKLNGSEYQIPLATIHAVSPSDPVGMNPFRNVSTYGVAVNEFMHEEETTLSGILSGSFTLLVRVDSTKSPALVRSQGLRPVHSPDAWFCLNTPEGSPLNSRDRYAISNVYNWGQIEQFKMVPQNWAIPLEDYDTLTPMLSSVTPLAHTVLKDKTIDNNSIDETLRDDVGSLTTDWITVGGENFWHITDVGGVGNRARLQFKDAGGWIWYDSEQSVGNASAAKLWRIPDNAQQVRIAFKQNANNTTSDIVIRPVPASIDPSFGTWSAYEFHVNQIVDFIPNTPYSFSVAFWNSYGGNYDENGFVVVSGGLKFTHNGRADREKFLGEVYNDGD